MGEMGETGGFILAGFGKTGNIFFLLDELKRYFTRLKLTATSLNGICFVFT
ncbi:hypothetical protein ACJX0J_010164, partial [Zea mays]